MTYASRWSRLAVAVMLLIDSVLDLLNRDGSHVVLKVGMVSLLLHSVSIHDEDYPRRRG